MEMSHIFPNLVTPTLHLTFSLHSIY